MTLTARELLAVQVSERSMSVLSILGSLFIITTFLRWDFFRKPINRLVFFASFGNMLTNVATLISTSALPGQSVDFSNLCEFQGIMIQWHVSPEPVTKLTNYRRFMMADTLWVFSMATNVMLVFFHNYDSRQLRRLEKWYLGLSYGLPGITAITYIVMDHLGPGHRKIIGPATIWCWVSTEAEWMRIAFFYAPIWVIICATLCIYAAIGRKIFKKRAQLRSLTRNTDPELGNTLTNPFTAANYRKIKVETEMKVETYSSIDLESVPGDPPFHGSFASTRPLDPPDEIPAPPRTADPQHDRRRTGYNATAFSTNRTQTADGYHSHSFSASQYNPNKRRNAAMEGNAAAWGYFKVAFLMFTALFIVWVPSTVNRLQQYIDKDHPIFGLNLASALVLPLQGFWNAMIYTSTTSPECKRALSEILDSMTSRRTRRRRRAAQYARERAQTSTTNGAQGSTAPIPLNAIKSTTESLRRLSASSIGSVRALARRGEK